MDVFQNLSDDQIAFIGCILALIVCASLMLLSVHIRPKKRGASADTQASSSKTISIKQKQRSANSDRRAA